MKEEPTIFSKNLRKMLKREGVNQRQLAEKVGVSQVMVHKILSSKVENSTRLIEIAKALRCSPEWLLTGNGSPDEGVSNVLPVDLITKKVIGSVSAGNLKELIEMDLQDDLETVYLPRKYLDDSKYFVLKIDGDSMTSNGGKHSFNDGDFMVFDKHQSASQGDYVLVYNEDGKSSVFKKLIKDGSTYCLQPLNNSYLMRDMKKEEVVIGVAVCHQPKSNFLK